MKYPLNVMYVTGCKLTAPLRTRSETDGHFPLKKNFTHKVRVNLSIKLIIKLTNFSFFFELLMHLKSIRLPDDEGVVRDYESDAEMTGGIDLEKLHL